MRFLKKMAMAVTTAAICCTTVLPTVASASDITCISHQYETIEEYEIFLGDYGDHLVLIGTITTSDGRELLIQEECRIDKIEHYVDKECKICGHMVYIEPAYDEYKHSNPKCPNY